MPMATSNQKWSHSCPESHILAWWFTKRQVGMPDECLLLRVFGNCWYTRAPTPHEKTRYSPVLGGPPETTWGLGAVRPGRGVPPPTHAPSGTAPPHDSNTTAPTAP